MTGLDRKGLLVLGTPQNLASVPSLFGTPRLNVKHGPVCLARTFYLNSPEVIVASPSMPERILHPAEKSLSLPIIMAYAARRSKKPTSFEKKDRFPVARANQIPKFAKGRTRHAPTGLVIRAEEVKSPPSRFGDRIRFPAAVAWKRFPPF